MFANHIYSLKANEVEIGDLTKLSDLSVKASTSKDELSTAREEKRSLELLIWNKEERREKALTSLKNSCCSQLVKKILI